MPRKKNLDLAEEINGEEVDVTEEEANDANQIVPTPVVAPPPAPPAVVGVTIADIQAIVKTAVEAAQSGNQHFAQIVTDGIAQARKPIPEKTDADYPRVSTLNPLGEKDHPRPGLKCEFYLGTKLPKTGQAQRTYPFVADDLTAQEQIALNTLEPTSGVVQLLDGAEIKVEVAPTRDDITNAIVRMVLVVPQYVIEKNSQHKNMLPSICNLVEQLTGKNFAKLSLDDLAYFMAEHRKKHYVSERESVAA
jgi:hypothetical protein